MPPTGGLDRRRYLSGIDWIIHGLNHTLECESGVGNLSQVVLDLDGTVDEQELRRELTRFLGRFPVLHGRLGRALNLAQNRARNRRVGVDRNDIEASAIKSLFDDLAVV